MFEAQTISKQLMDELLDYQFTAIEEREDREDMEAGRRSPSWAGTKTTVTSTAWTTRRWRS